MTLVIPHHHHQGWRLKQSAAAVLALLMLVECVLAVEPETCYSRQHQKAIVNVRQAVNKKGVLMDARVVRSERDCVLACCSEEVKPGAKCNMVVYNGNKQPGENNCFLFHCPAEQDCPLMKAVDGINTYDIYKGLIHFTTMRPTSTSTISTSTSSVAPNTQTLPPTTAAPTTTSASTTVSTTTQTPTTTETPTTIPPSTTTTTTTQSSTTSSSLNREPPRLIIITPIPAVESAMTTTTTEVTSLQRPNKSSKKQNKNTKKGRLHPVVPKTTSATTTLHVTLVDQEDTYRTAEKPQPQTESCVTTTTTKTPSTTIATTTTTTSPSTTPTSTTSTTAISTTTSTTTTTAPTTTSTTTVPPTTSTTTKELLDLISSSPAVSLLIVPKGVVQPEVPLQDQSQAKATTLGRGAVKSGVVAFMVLGLAMLTMALAIGGRKAMESFDRRHYTRLELNDLHYEV